MKIEPVLTALGYIPGISIIAGSVEIAIGVQNYIKSNDHFNNEIVAKGLEGSKSSLNDIKKRLNGFNDAYVGMYRLTASTDIESGDSEGLKTVQFTGRFIGFNVNSTVTMTRDEINHCDVYKNELDIIAIPPEKIDLKTEIEPDVIPDLLKATVTANKELLATKQALENIQASTDQIKHGVYKILWPVFPITHMVNQCSSQESK